MPCSVCRAATHNRRTCPQRQVSSPDDNGWIPEAVHHPSTGLNEGERPLPVPVRPPPDPLPSATTTTVPLIHLRDVAFYATLLARKLLLEYPHLSCWLAHRQFWSQCFDCVTHSRPKIREPFKSTNPDVYEALTHMTSSATWPWPPLVEGQEHPPFCQAALFSNRTVQLESAHRQLLTDGPVTWKLNFFRSMGKQMECPAPSKYASCVVSGSTISANLRQWYDEYHFHISEIWNQTVTSNDLYTRALRRDELDVTVYNCWLISHWGLAILHRLESTCPNVFRRHALSPIATKVPGSGIFQKLNPNQQLLRNPFKFFNKKKFKTFSVSSNGLSLRFTFSKKPKKTCTRRKNSEIQALGQSRPYFRESTRKRNKRINGRANRPRKIARRSQDCSQDLPIREDLFFVAVDPNHSNLCGWTTGHCSQENRVIVEQSGILLNPKAKVIDFPQPLTQSSVNTYSVESFNKYLIEIASLIMNDEQETISLVSQTLTNSTDRIVRRNKFDFVIRRQKRFIHFINKIKRLANNRETIIWFGNGGNGPSRQSTKAPTKKFLTEVKKYFANVKVGDEYMTSAKTNCCKVHHRKVYHEGTRRINNAYFECPRCDERWSRDISASRNQLEIAISEHFTGIRPETFRREVRE
ncbi:hypothetical protein P9112_002302 [Eukaryota sp. TZLM1-RC]